MRTACVNSREDNAKGRDNCLQIHEGILEVRDQLVSGNKNRLSSNGLKRHHGKLRLNFRKDLSTRTQRHLEQEQPKEVWN